MAGMGSRKNGKTVDAGVLDIAEYSEIERSNVVIF